MHLSHFRLLVNAFSTCVALKMMYNLMHWFVHQLVVIATFFLLYSDKDSLREKCTMANLLPKTNSCITWSKSSDNVGFANIICIILSIDEYRLSMIIRMLFTFRYDPFYKGKASFNEVSVLNTRILSNLTKLKRCSKNVVNNVDMSSLRAP